MLAICQGWAQDQSLGLMPMPASVTVGEGGFPVTKTFSVSLEGNFDPRLQAEATRFLRRLDQRTGSFFDQTSAEGALSGANLVVKVGRAGEVRLGEDEGYELKVDKTNILLTAKTDIGAIRGLETLLQLVENDGSGYYFRKVEIADQPRFQWRGIMLDVARHYMPLAVVYRNLDAMAALKLNVLHLHVSDDQGFRIQSEVYPRLNEVGSDGLFYTREEIGKLIAYADQRGIRVMPEIDVPGHATAILTAFPELGSKDTIYQLERNAGIFDPTLDPSNEDTYTFLEALFSEVATLFPDPYFHIGGDENLGKHWDANEGIQAFMKKKGFASNHELQTYFNIRLQKILDKLGKHTMGWEEIMAPEMPTTAVIHSWRGEWEGEIPKKSLYEAVKAGYQTVLSNGYYLDLMQTAEAHYLVDPAPASMTLTEEERSQILGGEMCMWSELVVPATIDSRLWPRGAAIAERLWSPEAVKDVADMYRRLALISLQLEQMGLQHLTSPRVILRNLARSKDIEPLETLLELVEPMKGYTRNPGGTMYTSFSPYTLWADAATPDARRAREFNQSVNTYLAGSPECDDVKAELTRWAANHQKALPNIQRSPMLQEIEFLSRSLSAAAGLGLEALAFLETNETPKAGWFVNARRVLEDARKQGGRTELQIVSGLTALVDHLERSVK